MCSCSLLLFFLLRSSSLLQLISSTHLVSSHLITIPSSSFFPFLFKKKLSVSISLSLFLSIFLSLSYFLCIFIFSVSLLLPVSSFFLSLSPFSVIFPLTVRSPSFSSLSAVCFFNFFT